MTTEKDAQHRKMFEDCVEQHNAQMRRAELAEEAENEAKDCFWAIYPDYLAMGGKPVSTEAGRTILAARVLELERALTEIRDDSEVHTKDNQTRLCCKFQHIATQALAKP